jgi:NADH-quinone oxidoreductase subunit N
MTTNDLYLLSPELSLAGLAMLLLLLDLVVRRKGFLTALAILGLAAPLGFSIALWLDGSGVPAESILADTLVVDRFSLFFKFLFIGVVGSVILISSDYARRFQQFRIEYYALLLFSTTGMMLMASAVELITIYISLELTTLPLVALAGFLRDGRSSEAGMKFLILSGISSALLLYGMVLVYGFTGSTVLVDVAARLGEIGLSDGQPFGSYALLMGIVLMVAGFGFKIAAVPFQMWVPDVYEGSPTPVTAFLSVASKAAGFAVILRVFYVAFPLETLSIEWSAIFAVLAALSMSLGNLVAIPQRNIKRMLAYSTVAHAGYLLVGVAAVAARATEGQGAIGPSGVLFYLGGYAVMNLAAFSAVIAISNRIGSDNIDDFAGMSRRAPYLAAVLAFAMISLTGVPPTVGFMVKIYIFGAAVSSGLAWLAVVGVLNSVVSAYYYLRVVRVMYLSPPPVEERIASTLPLRLVVLGTAAGVLFFGIFPRPLLELARTAAEVLVPLS